MRLDARQINVLPCQGDEVILNRIECRRDDVQETINHYLNEGYVIYDVSDAGGFGDLASPLTVGKYICVWKSAPAASYTLVLADITRHTDIIIVNAIVDNNNIVQSLISNTFSIPAGDYDDKLHFYGGTTVISSTNDLSNLSVRNTTFKPTGGSVSDVTLTNLKADFSNIISTTGYLKLAWSDYNQIYDYADSSETFDDDYPPVTNCQLDMDVASTFITLSFNVNNSYDWINGLLVTQAYGSSSLLTLTASSLRVVNFTGLKVQSESTFNLKVSSIYTDDRSVIYYETPDLVPTVASGSVWAYLYEGFTSGSATYISEGIDGSGNPYIAFRDGANSNKLTVMKLVDGAWSAVGGAGISDAAVSHVNMLIVSSTEIYVAYADGNASNKATVMKWNGSSWSAVGSKGFSTDAVEYIKVAKYTYIGDYIYVMYSDSGDSGKIKYQTYSSSWSSPTIMTRGMSAIIGKPFYFMVGSYMGGAAFRFLYIDESDNIYSYGPPPVGYFLLKTNVSEAAYHNGIVAYTDATNGKLSVCDTSGNLIGSSQFSSGAASYPAVYAGTDYFVAFQDDANSDKLTVMKWNSGTSTWDILGSAGFSSSTASYIALMFLSGAITAIFCDASSSSKASMMAYREASQTTGNNYAYEFYEGDVFDGKLALDIDLLENTADDVTLYAEIKTGGEFVETALGRNLNNKFTVELKSGVMFPDELKQFGPADYWRIRTEEFEEELVGKTIKNLILYDGVSRYAFDQSDNMLIVAEAADGRVAVLLWYNKKMRKTGFSDFYINVEYTIRSVFQLAALNDPITDFVNEVSTIDDSSATGTIVLNNMDREVVR